MGISALLVRAVMLYRGVKAVAVDGDAKKKEAVDAVVLVDGGGVGVSEEIPLQSFSKPSGFVSSPYIVGDADTDVAAQSSEALILTPPPRGDSRSTTYPFLSSGFNPGEE